MHTIEIKPVLNGFIVKVGCQIVVQSSKEALLSELKRYLDNPSKVSEEYLKNAINPDEKCPQLERNICEAQMPIPTNERVNR